MDPAGSGNDLIFPAQVALYGEPRDPREGSGPSPDPRPTSSLRPGPNANGPGHAFASPPSRRAIRRFSTGIPLLPPSYTGPKGNLSRAGHIRPIVHASAQAPDLSYMRESIRGSGKRGDRRPFLHSGGIFPSRHEKAPAPTFPTRGVIAISSLPAFLRTRDRARNRETRQHHAGPFRAGPFRLRGKVRVPLPFGSGLPFAGFCRLRVPGRTAFVRHRGLLRFRTLSALPQFPQVFRRVHEASHRPGSSSQRSRHRIGSSLTATDNH